MKNYKVFTGLASLQRSWYVCLTLLTLVIASFNVNATATDENKLLSISYNTIQGDQIALVFEFSGDISSLPIVDTAMNPAFVKIHFDAQGFDDKYKETLINHAGVTNVMLGRSTEKVTATINLEKLAVFDVALDGKAFTITFNYGIYNELFSKKKKKRAL